MNRNAWRIAALVTLVVAAVGGGLAIRVNGHFTWGTPEMPKAQCEALLAQPTAQVAYQARVAAAVVREPQNTWSNLAFVFVGVLIAARDRRPFPRLLGAALCSLGLTSGLYHASLSPAWRTADVAMMSWVTVALSCVGIAALRRKPSNNYAPFHLSIGGVSGALAMLAAVSRNDIKIAGIKPFDSTYTTVAGVALISALLLAGVVFGSRLGHRVRPSPGRIILLTAVVVAGIGCQLGDHPGHCFCHPESAVQAHAVWHILMAAAIALAYDTFAVIEDKDPLVRRS